MCMKFQTFRVHATASANCDKNTTFWPLIWIHYISYFVVNIYIIFENISIISAYTPLAYTTGYTSLQWASLSRD